MRQADLLVAQNKQMVEMMQDNPQLKNKPTEIINKGLVDFVRQPTTKREIIWIGRHISQKRPEIFIRLAQAFPQEQFVMICRPTQGQEKFRTLETMTQQVPNLKLVPGLPIEQIYELERAAKIFVLTSEWEGDLPMVAIESMMAKTPILSFSYDADNQISGQKLGLVAQGSWAQFIRDFKTLLQDQSYFGNLARDYALKKYSISSVAWQWRKLFQKLTHDK
jgi:glycosyltransferase involved in cell wall biosynthesis